MRWRSCSYSPLDPYADRRQPKAGVHRALCALCDLHKLFATIGFVSGIVAAVLWGLLLRGLALFRRLSWPSIACGIIAAVALFLMSWDENPVRAPGLYEQVATAVLSIWILLLATRAIGYDARH